MDTMTPTSHPPTATRPGGMRGVLEAAREACARGIPAALAVVTATEGSTYVGPGAMAVFDVQGNATGWLSGGCLEPEIAARARAAAQAGVLDAMEIDTRDDSALFAGAAVGCRGRLHLALLPLAALPGVQALLEAWCAGRDALRITVAADGRIGCAVASRTAQWTPPVAPGTGDALRAATLEIATPPRVLCLGLGPESPTLLPLLRTLGWWVLAIEPRERWRAHVALADAASTAPLDAALQGLDAADTDAALVMHHDFERDLDALRALAATPIGFVGLLGPPRRRDDLLRVLPAGARASLHARLHAPVGLDLGGRGPEAIALSIAAQLHAQHHAR